MDGRVKAWIQLRWKPLIRMRWVSEIIFPLKPQSAVKEGSVARRNRNEPFALFCSSTIRHTVKTKGSSLFFSSCLCICNISLSSSWDGRMGEWEDEGMEGEATKGCKLIRFLSLHAPLPVLLLSNPGGQRCGAQRLDSQTQWGNNWYKQHLAAETLSVSPSATFSPLSPVFFSQSLLSLIQKLFMQFSVSSFIRSFYQSFFWLFIFCLSLTILQLSLFLCYFSQTLFLFSSLLSSPSSTSSCLCFCLMFFCVSVPTFYQLDVNVLLSYAAVCFILWEGGLYKIKCKWFQT